MSYSSSSRRNSRKCPSIPLEEITDATNHFDEEKVLGKGGESTVYRANLYIGLKKALVAVKHLKPNSSEFENEIQIMTNIQHPNIVSLLGHCKQSGQKILIYEYMEKGSLANYVKGKSSKSLTWQQSLKICLDAARGLQRLHSETDEFPKGIIHRDVKPDNILLDGNLVGKISDFGMFKLSHTGQAKSSMPTMLRGTSGYYAPEYLAYNRVSRKIDIYSFGVVLFEVLCLKTPWDKGDESYYPNEDEDFGHRAQESIDSRIKKEISDDSLIIFTDIIRRSLQKDPNKRPTIDGVVLDLEKAMKSQNLKDEVKSYPRGTSTTSLLPKGLRVTSHSPTMDMDGAVLNLEKAMKRQNFEDVAKSYRGGTGTTSNQLKAPRYREEVDQFPKKYPPEVILYTDDQHAMKACTGAKNILKIYDATFEERSLRYPGFKNELERLVGSTKCPRLFVRGMDIGGIENIGKLHGSGKLHSILQQDKISYGEMVNSDGINNDFEKNNVEGTYSYSFPHIVPPGGENKLIVYMDNQSGSTRAHNILSRYYVAVEIRSILSPQYLYELQNLVGSTVCPRLFVRGMDIGGIENIEKLHNSNHLDSIMRQQVMPLVIPPNLVIPPTANFITYPNAMQYPSTNPGQVYQTYYSYTTWQ